MIDRMRSEYEQACALLESLRDCLERMEQIGVAEPWSWALGADVTRLFRSVQAAMQAAERQTNTPGGSAAAETDTTGSQRPAQNDEPVAPAIADHDSRSTVPPQVAPVCQPTSSPRAGYDRRPSFAAEAVITIHHERRTASDTSTRHGRHRRRP